MYFVQKEIQNGLYTKPFPMCAYGWIRHKEKFYKKIFRKIVLLHRAMQFSNQADF